MKFPALFWFSPMFLSPHSFLCLSLSLSLSLCLPMAKARFYFRSLPFFSNAPTARRSVFQLPRCQPSSTNQTWDKDEEKDREKEEEFILNRYFKETGNCFRPLPSDLFLKRLWFHVNEKFLASSFTRLVCLSFRISNFAYGENISTEWLIISL